MQTLHGIGLGVFRDSLSMSDVMLNRGRDATVGITLSISLEASSSDPL